MLLLERCLIAKIRFAYHIFSILYIPHDICKCGGVVWRERVSWEKRTCGNPVMTFPIKERINTDLFSDKMAAL